MTFSFHPRAEQELAKAVRYYEECRSGLWIERRIAVLTESRSCLNEKGFYSEY